MIAGLNHAFALLFATRCAACAALNTRPFDNAVCPDCWAAIDRFDGGGILHWPAARITAHAAIGPHEGPLRVIVQALKYDGRRSVAARLSMLMRDAGRPLLAAADVVVPVPLHRRRAWTRGFNQADLLARGLGRPVARLLRRQRSTAPQVSLPADARRQNVDGAFALVRWPPPRVRDRRILLVDDVFTTGATLEACARVLHEAGAREVMALTAARAVIGRRS
ncbi:MAG: ComF family protein [Acidobacteria bacterium]|nr:ComF family protein [Acidobacteriota bacterium]